MGMSEDLKIPSSRDPGLQIALSIFSPETRTGPRPVIILGHGIGGIKAAGLVPFASAFSANGYHAITFDYLHFGESDGQPRGLLSISGQLQDFRDVIAWARRQTDRFDPRQVVVWGSSFGGMHTTALIASDHELAGAIAQCPCVDSFAASSKPSLSKSLSMTKMAIHDRIGSFFGKEPVYVNLTGDGDRSSGSPIALMEGPEVLQGWHRVSSNVVFPNVITARSLLEFPMHRPVLDLKKSKKPYLIVLPTYDNEAPLEAAEDAVRNAALGESIRVRGGHFDLYAGGIAFDANLAGQLAFLDRILI